jgi:EAL domain-containing protein (putative c-di-GMP-specific phosphodiesterase class I)
MNLVSKIQRALAEDGFVLYSQPIVALSSTAKTSGQIEDADQAATHFELLLRMRGENGQLVPPGLFIPAAERYGLMPLLDRWVINQAFA